MMTNRGMYDQVTYEDTATVKVPISFGLRQTTRDVPNTVDEWDFGEESIDYVAGAVRSRRGGGGSPSPRSRVTGCRHNRPEHRRRLREYDANICQRETDYYTRRGNFKILEIEAMDTRMNLAKQILKLEHNKNRPRKPNPRNRFNKESLYRMLELELDKEKKEMKLEMEMEADLLRRILKKKDELAESMNLARNKYTSWTEKRREKREKLESEVLAAQSQLRENIPSPTPKDDDPQVVKTVRSILLAESSDFADELPAVKIPGTQKKANDLVKVFNFRKIPLSIKIESANAVTVISTKAKIEETNPRLPVFEQKEPTILSTGFGITPLDSLIIAVDNVDLESFKNQPPPGN